MVLTGAGISTDSGIPDFRGPQGVWTRDPAAEKAAHIDVYVTDPEVRRRAWQNRLTSPFWKAEPNEGHAAIVTLERGGQLDTLVTQNIDGLHQKAGSDPRLIIEIHGNSSEIVCLRCNHRQPAEPVHDRVRAGEEDPTCREPTAGGSACGGMLKSATISFGQSLVAADLRRAEDGCRPVRPAPLRGFDPGHLPGRGPGADRRPFRCRRGDRQRRPDRDGRAR